LRDLRTRRRLTTTALLGSLGLGLAACGPAPQSVLDPQGPFAQGPDDLFRVVLFIALGVFIVVQGLIIYAVVKFRDRGDDALPVQVHGNTRLEIFWTLIPALILAGIAVPTVRQVFELAETPDDALTIEVIGHRWWWEYHYVDNGGFRTANELVLPVDRPIHLVMTAEEPQDPSKAVIHAFWVPALAGKQDVVPGRITTLNMQADTTGSFIGACTEYCGLSHANMRNYATVVSQADFDAWVAQQNEPASAPEPGSLAAEGAALFGNFGPREGTSVQACVACHNISGANEGSRVGPDLTHLMSRERFAGAIYDLYLKDADGNYTDEPNVELLKAWIKNAPALKAMQPEFNVGMPNMNLTDEEVDAIVAYLLTLR
jgi:cytochrome c oxidase subunit II